MMKLKLLTGLFLFCIGTMVTAATDAELQAYMEVVTKRASKIMEGIELGEREGERGLIIQCIAEQYRDLHVLQEAGEKAAEDLESALEPVASNTLETALEVLKLGLENERFRLHAAYVSRLSALLPADQVNAVKDGMTYGVMPGTYAVYLDMLPDLTEEQRRQIRGWLMEAREHAMDAGSSDEKHRVFGKYKGRINNYLSAAGYDLKEAERQMWERKKNKSSK